MNDAETSGAGDTAPTTTSNGMTDKRRERRSREHQAARQCMVAIVDYLTTAAGASEPPRRIGELALLVSQRAGAIAAARQFIAECETTQQ